MAKNVFLFDLIHGLSKNEKRYVRLQLEQQAKGKKSKYLSLFDAISKHPDSNESRLKSTMKNYAGLKNYLTENILSSLASYHNDSDAEYVAHRDLKYCMICFEKGHIKEFEKRLKKLKKFCYATNLFGTLFQVVRYEMWTNGRQVKNNEPLFKEMKHILKLQENFIVYQQLYHEVLGSVFKSDARASDHTKSIKNIDLLKSEELALSFSARSMLLSANMALEYSKMNYRKSRDYR